MKDYIKRIRKIGTNDAVNGEVLNSVTQQLQHNIDLLYSSQNNTRQDKNLAELLYGNLLDYDQIGYKRFVNGGSMDAIEKILAFDVSSGDIYLDEADFYTGTHFLTWVLDENISNNIELVRTIKVPEALLGQKLIIGVKLIGFSEGIIASSERFDIYVNNKFSGSGDTGLISIDGVTTFKSIYGVYDLGSEETDIEIRIVRSITNDATSANYVIRLQNMHVGMHALSISSFELNFPTTDGPFTGVVPDVSDFYNFENVNVIPIPKFIFSSRTAVPSGSNSSYTINITSQNESPQSVFYVGPVGSGDQTGIDGSNRISFSNFFNMQKNTSHLEVYFEPSTTYVDFIFEDGNIYDITFEGDISVSGQGLTAKNSSQLNISTDYDVRLANIEINNATINLDNNGIEENTLTVDNNLTVIRGNFDINVGIFSMPIVTSGEVVIKDKSNVNIEIPNTSYTNTSAEYGFGFSTGNILVDNHSNFSVTNNNTNLLGHIGYGNGVDKSIVVNKHSSLTFEGLGELSTSSAEKVIKASIHSSIEIEEIQKDGGVTAFDSYELNVFSSFSTTAISGISGTSVQSYTYEY